jgi:hypothetical protein
MTTKKKKSNFRGKVGADAKRQKREGKSFGYLLLPKDVKVFSAKPGTKNVRLDFLPYVVTDAKHPDRNEDSGTAVAGSQWYKRPYAIHRNIGGGQGDSVVCLASIGKKCPICIKRAELQKKDSEKYKEEIEALRPSKRNIYIVIPKGSKEYEEVPHIFDMSQRNFQDLLNEELEENEEHEVFPDLEEGETLKIRFGSATIGKGKPFAEASKIEFEEREEGYSEDILEEVPNLDEILKVLSYKELEAKFLENEDEEDGGTVREADDDEDDEDEDEEDETPKKKKTSKSKKQEEDDEEDEEDDEEDEEDEEEEEDDDEDSDDDEDEEDEDEDEDEEEESPKKSKNKKPIKRRR